MGVASLAAEALTQRFCLTTCVLANLYFLEEKKKKKNKNKEKNKNKNILSLVELMLTDFYRNEI